MAQPNNYMDILEDRYGFAPANSQEEVFAAQTIAEQLQDHGLATTTEEFSTPTWGEKAYAIFEKAGYECPSINEENRKLIFENPACGVRFFWVKPSDVAIYVERGAADIGVVGKDILLEYAPEVYEMLDLNVGRCRVAVAAKRGFCDSPQQTLRVATKFSNIAKKHYASIGRDIDIIHQRQIQRCDPVGKRQC